MNIRFKYTVSLITYLRRNIFGTKFKYTISIVWGVGGALGGLGGNGGP